MRFAGIDLAWSPRNRSGGAILSAGGQLVDATAGLGSDDEIVEYLSAAIPEDRQGLVAIDAPLAVPNAGGGRECDRQVASVFGPFQAAPYPANRTNLGRYGGLRAELIRQRLQALGFSDDPYIPHQRPVRRVVEVFPHPATVSLFDLEKTLKYKQRQGRDYAYRWRELARLRDHLAALSTATPPLHLPPEITGLPIDRQRGQAFKAIEDMLDAIVCAYSALYAWYHGPWGYAVYGSADQGHIVVPMTPTMWQRIKPSPPRLLMLDRDGTLNVSPNGRPPNRPEEVEILPGVAAELHRRAALGWRLVIITNQGGVAFGYQTEAQAWAIHQAVLAALPVSVDATYLCPHHPRGTIGRYAVDCPNRKPSPGALLEALRHFEARAEDCCYVGDMDTDRQAAEAAGVPFMWAQAFFDPNI